MARLSRGENLADRSTGGAAPAASGALLPEVQRRARVQAKLVQLFGADLRSLAIFRIVLATIVLLDLAGRLRDLRVHYTDAGVLPGELARRSLGEFRWSLNLLNGSVSFQVLIFAVTALAALALLLGYRTRLMSVIVWALLFSIQTRNPLVLSAADTYIRLMLFWSIFLPLGAWWSLDQRRRKPSPAPRSPIFISMGTAALFLQIAFVYWFTALLKSEPAWREEGTALYYAFAAEHLTKPFGEYLHQFPTLLKVLTHASFGLEVVVPILLFAPVFTGPVRTLAAMSIMAFQFGIYLTLDVGLFPWISAFSMVCFFPAWFWDTALPRLSAKVLGRPRIAGRRFWQPVIQPLRALALPMGRLTAFQLSQSGDVHAATVTGGTGAPPQTEPAPIRLRSSLDVNVAAAFFLLFIFGWNLTTVTPLSIPSSALPIAQGLGIYQRWNMFAPQPIQFTEWYVYEGTLRNGQQIDVLAPIVQNDLDRIEDVSWSQPDSIASNLYGDKYWRKYLGEIGEYGKSRERVAFSSYVCRTWNDHHQDPSEQLVNLQIFEVIKPTLPDYQPSRPDRTSIYEGACG